MKYLLGLLAVALVSCTSAEEMDHLVCESLVSSIKYKKLFEVKQGFYQGMDFVPEERLSYYKFSGKLMRDGYFENRVTIDGRNLFDSCKNE